MNVFLEVKFNDVIRLFVVIVMTILMGTLLLPYSPDVESYITTQTRLAIIDQRARLGAIEDEIQQESARNAIKLRLAQWEDQERARLKLVVDFLTLILIGIVSAIVALGIVLVRRTMKSVSNTLDKVIYKNEIGLKSDEQEEEASRLQMRNLLRMQRQNRAE